MCVCELKCQVLTRVSVYAYVSLPYVKSAPDPPQQCSVKKDTTVVDQIAFSNSISHSWPTVVGFLQLFDTEKIYSTAGMKIPQAGLGIEKTDLLSCSQGLIPIG